MLGDEVEQAFTEQVKNLGVHIGAALLFEKQFSALAKSTF